MDIDREQSITLQYAAHNLVTYPPPSSGILSGKNARHRGVLEAISKEGLKCIIAFPLGGFENAAIEEPDRLLIVVYDLTIPDIPCSPDIFCVMK